MDPDAVGKGRLSLSCSLPVQGFKSFAHIKRRTYRRIRMVLKIYGHAENRLNLITGELYDQSPVQPNGLLHAGKIGPHGPQDLFRRIIFHKGGKVFKVRKHHRTFPPFPFHGNATRKNFVPNFGCHILAKGGAKSFPFRQSPDHGVAGIPQNTDLIIAHHLDVSIVISLSNPGIHIQNIFQGRHDRSNHQPVQDAGTHQENTAQNHRKHNNSRAVLPGRHSSRHQLPLHRNQGDQQNNQRKNRAHTIKQPDATSDSQALGALQPR